VEAAVAVPLLLFLVFGFIELAGTLRAYATAESAVRAAGRTGSVAANDPFADRAILRRLASEAGPLGRDTIDYVVVWHASGPGEKVPAACRPETTVGPNGATLGVGDGGVDALGACNVYVRPGASGGAFERLEEPVATLPFGCAGAADPRADDKLDCAWPAQNRRVLTTPRTVFGPAIPTDFIGVHVQLRHDHLVQLIGRSSTLTESSVNLIEPRGYAL
jgi:hypothetical protein